MSSKQLTSLRNPPLNRIYLPLILVLLAAVGVCAQTPEPTRDGTTSTPVTAESIQLRIERARALAAAHQLPAAASELEAIRRSTPDAVVRNVTSVMLMGIYLEEGNYTRAESLLEEDFSSRAGGSDAALRTYFATAGQALNGARSHLARYRSFGINISDSNLPAEATNDLNRLRRLLERMVAQAQNIAAQRKEYDALALLEDVLAIRISVATDGEDRAKWESEYANARELLASNQSQIASLNGVPSLQRSANQPSRTVVAPVKEPPAAAAEPVPTPTPTVTTSTTSTAPAVTTAATSTPRAAEPSTETPAKGDESNTLSTGVLNSRATKRVVPSYPQLAKSTGVQGVVKVYVTIDEMGKVIAVNNVEGHSLLRQAATDAARGWRFSPTVRDGKSVKLTGFIEFNFTL